ncbi:tRNA 2-thiouridine(34) synthase MnmA [candidate division WWE3 bacterium]|nr:tRNA 2-thiouridine(34) synthase MnmA [candidate division WWE3 bacterium]
MKSKIAVGLSGGVDSSVTAALLKDQGCDVIGVHMLRWDTDMPGCTGDIDRADALKVAKKLNIPFRTVDFRHEYQHLIIDRFLEEFRRGRTPNPDIWCNEFIKFGAFQDYAVNVLGADGIATGHYARIIDSDRIHGLYTGVDAHKDQSYFLYRLSERQLSKAIFPLGEYTKGQVRELAEKYDLATAQKPDSVGICFIGDIDLTEFLKENLHVRKGDVVDINGNVIGNHDGVPLYTIGQRHGFTLTNYQGMPVYVIKKDNQNNRLIVGRGERTLIEEFCLVEEHWIHNNDITTKLLDQDVTVRIRHLGNQIPVVFSRNSEGIGICRLTMPIAGIAEGQHAVLYNGDRVVGGGVISYFY